MADEAESLWAAGKEVIRVLHGRGHEAYLVGGCVRDRLLGRPLHDIDIATSARPEEVTNVFVRTIPTGLQHGTVTVLHQGKAFEVTTYRTETGYSDARRPDQVAFVNDIREDLARRDFTINAMAFGLHEEWIDPFGGRKDLAVRRIRCVGDAGKRFGEDALRMVRAIRFAAEFGFRLNLSVWRGIRSQRTRLRHVAMERVGSEWDKMMGGACPDRACELLSRSGLLSCLKEPLPEFTADKQDGAQDGIRPLGQINDKDIRWIAWLIRSGAASEDAVKLCRALRFSSKRETRITASVTFHRRLARSFCDRSAFVNAVLDLGRPAVEDWLETRGQPEPFREWLADLVVHSVGQLAVRGDELARYLDRKPGPWVARLLRGLLEEAAMGRVRNEREALLHSASDLQGIIEKET
jgi:tRNA nucleotidyltransferase (CCA-adding enzyme)